MHCTKHKESCVVNALELIVISLFIFLSPVLLYATARDL
jgi:hypothetical protein